MRKLSKEEKVKNVAFIIQNLLEQIDMYCMGFSKDDFEILNEAEKELKKKISFKQNGAVLLYALGSDPNTLEDEMKLKTIEVLIQLFKIRINYKDELIKQIDAKQKSEELLNQLKAAGLF